MKGLTVSESEAMAVAVQFELFFGRVPAFIGLKGGPIETTNEVRRRWVDVFLEKSGSHYRKIRVSMFSIGQDWTATRVVEMAGTLGVEEWEFDPCSVTHTRTHGVHSYQGYQFTSESKVELASA